MARSKVKDRRRVSDHYARLAKNEGYAARSVYKLKEIDQKHRLLRRGMKVLDLGCSPGSWTQYAAEIVGPEGLVVGVDLTRVDQDFGKNVRLIQADVADLAANDFPEAPFDIVLSDMAPNTSGAKHADQARSMGLVETAWYLGRQMLVPGGAFLYKVFMGPDVDDFIRALSGEFGGVKRIKPKSSRSFSPEIFVLAQGFTK